MRAIRVAALLVLGFGGAHAGDKELQQAVEGASRDLAGGEWRKAQQALEIVRPDYRDSLDNTLRGRYEFFDALAAQQCAADPKVDGAEREKARQAAIASYEWYLENNGGSGGALNNLAQLYAQDPAKRDKALALYDRATILKDPRANAYQVNRARLLADMGSTDQALRASLDASRQNPRSVGAQGLALQLLEKRGNTAEIADFVRQLEDSGQVVASIDTAMSELERLSSGREPVLIALAESLANPGIGTPPRDFPNSDTGSRLGKLVDAPDIGSGVQQLLALFAQKANPGNVSWWRVGYYEHEEAPPKSRGLGFLNLARALGDRCKTAGAANFACAEYFYQFAIDFTGTSADPQAFLALAQIYASTGRQDQIADIAKKYEKSLMNGKMTAYSRDNKPRIFQFHMALGTLYGTMDRWTNPANPTASAVFQLEHARRTAADYNHQAKPGEQLKFPEAAAEMLSAGYVKTGRVDDSTKLRVDVAEEYLATGDKESAAQLLDKQWRSTVPATTNADLLKRVSLVGEKAGVKY